jgi:hypothetical protein
MSFVSDLLNTPTMQRIEDIYRTRLRLLALEFGSQVKLAATIDRPANQVSQWINASKDSKTGKPRALSRDMARFIEKKAGKPEGWMDQPLTVGDLARLEEGKVSKPSAALSVQEKPAPYNTWAWPFPTLRPEDFDGVAGTDWLMIEAAVRNELRHLKGLPDAKLKSK